MVAFNLIDEKNNKTYLIESAEIRRSPFMWSVPDFMRSIPDAVVGEKQFKIQAQLFKQNSKKNAKPIAIDSSDSTFTIFSNPNR